MKKKKTESAPANEYIRAARKGSREAEIEQYGHPLNHHRIFKSKKVYDRKKIKAGDKGLPYLFITAGISGPFAAFSRPICS